MTTGPSTPSSVHSDPGVYNSPTIADMTGRQGGGGNSGGSSTGSSQGTGNNGPKFGGLSSDLTPWVGGPPNIGFTGSLCTSPESPCCYRPTDATAQMRSYPRRVEGNETKFKRDDPEYTLISFATDSLAHMKEYGMDTFFYLEGSNSEDEAQDLFNYHTRYSTTQVEDYIKECLGQTTTNPIGIGKLDHWGLDALKDSGTWLMNSLDETMRVQLRPQLPPRPYGPQVWMILVREVQMDSLRRVTIMVKKFESTKVSDFKGENVRDYCTAVQDILIQLEKEKQLPPTHLLTLVDAFCDVSVQDFRVGWMARKKDVNNFVRDSAGKDPHLVLQLPNYTHFRTLLAEAKQDYQNNLHRWGTTPAKDAQLAAMQSKLDKVTNQLSRVNQQLEQKPDNGNNNSNKDKDKCATCGGSHATNQHDAVMKKKAANKIKYAAPKQGEPHTKEIDGRTMHYCSKCSNGNGRWTGHLTKDHKDNYQPQKRKGGRKHKGNLHRLENAASTAPKPAAAPTAPSDNTTPPPAPEGDQQPLELAPLSATFTHLTLMYGPAEQQAWRLPSGSTFDGHHCCFSCSATCWKHTHLNACVATESSWHMLSYGPGTTIGSSLI